MNTPHPYGESCVLALVFAYLLLTSTGCGPQNQGDKRTESSAPRSEIALDKSIAQVAPSAENLNEDQASAVAIDGWSTFPVGSWVIHVHEENEGDNARPTRARTTYQGVGVNDGAIMTLRQVETDRTWDEGQPSRLKIDRDWLSDWFVVGQPTQENVRIDGAEVACAKTTYQIQKKSTSTITHTMSIWTAPDITLPYRNTLGTGGIPFDAAIPTNAVRIQSRRSKDDREANAVWEFDRRITSTKVKKQIDGRKVNCVKEEFSGTGTMDGKPVKISGYQLYSPQIPGHLAEVRLETALPDDNSRVSHAEAVAFGPATSKSP